MPDDQQTSEARRPEGRTAWQKAQARVIALQHEFRKEQEAAVQGYEEERKEKLYQLLWTMGLQNGGQGERYPRFPRGIF